MQGQIQGQIYQLWATLLIIVNSYKLWNGIVLWSWNIWNLLVQPIGNQYMYGKKQKKKFQNMD